MIVLGIILLLVAVMNPQLAALWGVGIIALFVGMVLAVCGAIGRGVGSRRHPYQGIGEHSTISPRRTRRHEAQSQRGREEQTWPGAPRNVTP